MCLNSLLLRFGRRRRRYQPTPTYFPTLPMYQALYDQEPYKMSQRLTIHRLLRYNNHASSGMPCCSIMYDLRDVPHRAFLHPTAGVAYRPSYTSSSSSSSRPLTTKELYEPATYPPVSRLSITCGLFPILW